MNKTMQEVLYENKMKYRRAELARLKKQQKKERILATFVGVFIVGAMATILILANGYNKKEMIKCMENHSYNECIAHM